MEPKDRFRSASFSTLISVGISLLISTLVGGLVYTLVLFDLKTLKETGEFGPGKFVLGILTGSENGSKFAPPKICEADTARLCSNSPTILCLRNSFDELEAGCKENIREGILNELGSCKEDFEKHCQSVEPGQGRIKGCLMMKKNLISKPCREQLQFD